MRKYMTFILLVCLFTLQSHSQEKISVNIETEKPQQTINRHIYGHFAEHLGRCIYGGFWIDESLSVEKKDRIRMDIVNALKAINIPNLRWPGGCFADEYQWKDGIGKRSERPKRINSHWGQVVEDNSFGTHEFLELCNLLNCEPYIAVNVGSSSPNEMREWIEYMNFDGESTIAKSRKQNGREKPWGVKFWGIGNENWGCGGEMTPEFYANQYRLFQSYARGYSGNHLLRIAGGPNSADYNWMEVCMRSIPPHMMWGISMHYYTVPTSDWSRKGSATSFDENEYFNTMKNALFMEELLQKHTAIMDKYDPNKSVALVVDEWGVWTDVEPNTNPSFLYQQNTMRDALVAATTLNLFNKHSDRVRMANLAQTINVLQALILTKDEKMLLTPTYHVFDLFKVHQDANLLPISFKSPDYQMGNNILPAINISASKDKNGVIHISMVNIDHKKKQSINLTTSNPKLRITEGNILTSDNFAVHNTFEQAEKIKTRKFSSYKNNKDNFSIELPPLSVVVLTIK